MTTYSNVWSDTIPPGTAPANTIDDIIRAFRVDVDQRLSDLHGITDFTTDPLKALSIRAGYTGSSSGGRFSVTTQDGVLRYYVGAIGSVGDQSFSIYDVVNGTTRLSIDASSGNIDLGSGFTASKGILTAGVGTVGLTVNGAANQWSQIISGSATSGQSYGLIVQAGTTPADKAFEVDSASGGQYFSIRGDGLANFNGGVVFGSGIVVNGLITANAGITGSFSGPLTGNVTGNVSGSSGSCTGNAASASSIAAGGITGSIIDTQITSLSASKLSGALPAISGASLTSITGGNVTGTVASATTAGNATNLGGVAASSYALKNGSSAIVVSGASVTAAAFYIV